MLKEANAVEVDEARAKVDEEPKEIEAKDPSSALTAETQITQHVTAQSPSKKRKR